MLHLHKPPSQQSSIFSLRGCISIIGGCLIAILLVTLSIDNHRVVRLPQANLDDLVNKYVSPSTSQVLTSQMAEKAPTEAIVSTPIETSKNSVVITSTDVPTTPKSIDVVEPHPKASSPHTSSSHAHSEETQQTAVPSTTTSTTAEATSTPSEVPVSRPAPAKPKFPIHIGPIKTTVQPASASSTTPSPSISSNETQSTSATSTETKPIENHTSDALNSTALAPAEHSTSASSEGSPIIASDSSPSQPTDASIAVADSPPALSSLPPPQAKVRDPTAWTPSVVPSHCLCENMFTRTNSPPTGLYTLKPAPEAVMKNDSFVLPSYYSSDNTGDAAMNDPRWRQYMYYEECGMMLPRDVLINKVPPTVGKDFDLQLPTCLLQDVWLNVPDLSKQYMTSESSSTTSIPQGRGAAALALAMANANLNQLTAETPRALTPPLMSIELVVFNQADYISQVLMPILHLTRQPFELVILFDTADDESIQVVQGILHAVYRYCDVDTEFSSTNDWELFPMKKYNPRHGDRFSSPARSSSNWACLNPYLVHVRTLFQPTPLFETASNNVQFRASHPASKYYISVQDDQPMETLGWNELLTRPFEWYDDVIGVSARCAHGFYTERHIDVNIGRCGADVFQPLDHSKWHPQDLCAFYVRDSANRGPLALHAERLKAMGYLDEQHIRLDGDDHDLFARSYVAQQWKAGFMPLEWASDPIRGGMRKQKRPPTEKELFWKDYRARYALTTPKGLDVVRKRAFAENWPNHNEKRKPPPNALKHCLVKPEGKQDFDANGNVVFFTKQWWQEQEDPDENISE